MSGDIRRQVRVITNSSFDPLRTRVLFCGNELPCVAAVKIEAGFLSADDALQDGGPMTMLSIVVRGEDLKLEIKED